MIPVGKSHKEQHPWFTRCQATIFTLDGRTAFDMIFYGLKAEDFFVTPGGAAPIISGLRRRGLNPDEFESSMFTVRDLR